MTRVHTIVEQRRSPWTSVDADLLTRVLPIVWGSSLMTHVTCAKRIVALLLTFLCLGAAYASVGDLLPGSTRYPRVIRLAHGDERSNGWIIASTISKLFVSKDDGKTFQPLSDAPSRDSVHLRCCETIFELPEALGDLKAGTLLYAATYTKNPNPPRSSYPTPSIFGEFAIEVFSSVDQGEHWSYLSTPVTGTGEKGVGGLWEPEFLIANDHSLVMFWSDETYKCCSQKLLKIRSVNGHDWTDSSDVVATKEYADRPGMIVVRKLPTGRFFMIYEMCGTHHCEVFSRMSSDGWNYGPPANPGTRLENEDGQYFRHAPAVIWSPSPLSPNGMLIAVGQVLYNPNGTVAKGNGQVLFANVRLDGSGPWFSMQAPVPVPFAFDNPCPNYSSSLLPVGDGKMLLEVATDFYGLNRCGAFAAIRPLADLIPAELMRLGSDRSR